jgi:hypothetical protein
MKRQSVVLLAVLFSFFISSAQNTLTVASWNIEWFGSPSNGPSDDNLQEANVKTILRYLNADIYGLVEVVDTMRLRRVTDSLGSNYKYVIADFCSNNTTGTGNGWLTGQKEAFIYKQSVFSNVKARGLMRTSATAYTNWASGRFPYLLNADVTINGTTRNINFIVIHGKSGSTQSDYDRRRDGAQELKDTLDARFTNQNIILIGDYNDALNQTICSGCTTSTSSYSPIVSDSARYKSITLPLAYAGQTTMINFPNVIDNHIVSTPTYAYYIPASEQIRTDVTSVVANYLNDNTSDHYPVTSKYNLAGVATAIPSITLSDLKIKVYPNPFSENINLYFDKTVSQVGLELTNVQGQTIATQNFNRIIEGSTITPSFQNVARGIYFLNIITADSKTVVKLVRL